MFAAFKEQLKKPNIDLENIRLDAKRYGQNAELVEWLGLASKAAERVAGNGSVSEQDAMMLRRAYFVLKSALQPVKEFEDGGLHSVDYR